MLPSLSFLQWSHLTGLHVQCDKDSQPCGLGVRVLQSHYCVPGSFPSQGTTPPACPFVPLLKNQLGIL